MADFEWLAPGGHKRLVDNVVGLLAEKPDSDALEPLLTAGAALGITGNDAEESAWFTRTSEAGGVASVRSIHGRTVGWNQLFNAAPASSTSNGVTFTVEDSSIVANGTATGLAIRNTTGQLTANHKYLYKGCPSGGSLSTYYAYVSGPDSGFIQRDTGAGVLFTALSSGTTNMIVDIVSGNTVSNLKFTMQLFDLTQMFGAGSEPSTVAEFEALYPLPYYEYDAGSLLPVNMTGIESTGKNLFDVSLYPAWSSVFYGRDGESLILNASDGTSWYDYGDRPYVELPAGAYKIYTQTAVQVQVYDLDELTQIVRGPQPTFTLSKPTKVGIKFIVAAYPYTVGTVQLERGSVATSYEPYWHQQRSIPAGTLRSAGTAYDELTATERIVRVGEVDLGTLTWTYSNGFFRTSDLNSVILRPANNNTPADAKCSKYEIASWNSEIDKSMMVGRDAVNPLLVKDTAYTDAAAFKAALSGVMLHYALATPTVTPIDPPLNLSYRVDDFGTERVMVPTGENSAPPTIVAAQGYTAESLRDAALSAIAPVENGLASANYGVGAYLVHAGQLCRVTTAIATGEAISIGTNVTATTVMAEVIALIAQ